MKGSLADLKDMKGSLADMKLNLRLLAPTIINIQAAKFQFWGSQSQTTASSTGSKTTKAISAGTSTKDASSADASTKNPNSTDTSSIAVNNISGRALKKLKAANKETNLKDDGDRTLKKNLLDTIKSHDADYKIKCMLTGTEEKLRDDGSNNIVRCAHILPHRWKNDKDSKLENIGFSRGDLESARNGIFLCEGFEIGLDDSQLCFVRNEDFFHNNRIVMKVLNSNACKKIPIFQGSTESVDDYDGRELNLQCGSYQHNPFRTALYAHALQAHLRMYDERKVSSDCEPLLSDVSPERLNSVRAEFLDFAGSVTKLYSSINHEVLNEIREDEEEGSINVVKEEEDYWLLNNENSCHQGEEDWDKDVAEVYDEADGVGLQSV